MINGMIDGWEGALYCKYLTKIFRRMFQLKLIDPFIDGADNFICPSSLDMVGGT